MSRRDDGPNRAGRRELALSGFWFQDLPLPQFLERAVSHGFDSVGLWTNQYDVPVEELRRQLNSGGINAYCLNVSSRGPRLNTADLEEVEQAQALIHEAIDRADSLSVPVIQTYCAAGADLPEEAMIERYSEQLRPCVQRAARAGIRITIENNVDRRAEDPLGRNPSRRPDSLKRLVDSIDDAAFGITFDPCNFLITGADPVEAYQSLSDSIACVEFKDARKIDGDRDDPGRAVLHDSVAGAFEVLPIGHGDVDFPALLALMNADGYTGPFVLDPFGEGEPLDSQLTVGAAEIRTWSQKTALPR